MAQLGVWVASLTLGLSLLILGLLFLRRDQGFGAGPILLGFAILALAPATSALVLPNMSSPWHRQDAW